MLNIINQLNIDKYTILTLDGNPLNEKKHKKYLIDNVTYIPVTVYDMPNCIVITKSNDNLVGKKVEFVN